MADTAPASSSDCLKAAWAALLRGDVGERDRLCERAKKLIVAERYAAAVENIAAVDFYVHTDGLAIPTKLTMRTVGVTQ